jgi:acyl carrier protein
MGKPKTTSATVTQESRVASREELEGRLRAFVRAVAGEVTIRRDTPLFTRGLLDSMRVLDLLVLIETSIGRTLSDDEITAGNFRSIASISATFWREDSGGRNLGERR